MIQLQDLLLLYLALVPLNCIKFADYNIDIFKIATFLVKFCACFSSDLH